MIPADARHLKRMLEWISLLQSRSRSLSEGADTLDFFHRALEARDQPWDDEFTSLIVTLDSAGTASQEQIAQMGSRFDHVVDDALDTLAKMIRSRFPDGIVPTEHDEEEDF